jgi:hypothetical protein
MCEIAIISYFKDESHILREWLLHHINIGIDFFYLLDNGSRDNYKLVTNEFINYIKIINVDKLNQTEAIRLIFNKIKNKHEWICVIDLDEFIYHNNSDIKDILKYIPKKIGCITIECKLFLPKDKLQPISVIENNTIRIKNDTTLTKDSYKSIVRTCAVKVIFIHDAILYQPFEHIKYKINDNSFQINHYRFQSYEYLVGIKSKRGGGVDKKRYNNPLKLLKKYESLEQIEDKILYLKSKKIINTIHKYDQIKPRIDLYL